MRRMTAKDTYISIAGQQPTVTLVNIGAMTSRQPGTGITRQVLVTPLTQSIPADTNIQQCVFAATRSSLNSQLSSLASLTQQQHTVSKVDKVLLKVVNKRGKGS